MSKWTPFFGRQREERGWLPLTPNISIHPNFLYPNCKALKVASRPLVRATHYEPSGLVVCDLITLQRIAPFFWIATQLSKKSLYYFSRRMCTARRPLIANIAFLCTISKARRLSLLSSLSGNGKPKTYYSVSRVILWGKAGRKICAQEENIVRLARGLSIWVSSTHMNICSTYALRGRGGGV